MDPSVKTRRCNKRKACKTVDDIPLSLLQKNRIPQTVCLLLSLLISKSDQMLYAHLPSSEDLTSAPTKEEPPTQSSSHRKIKIALASILILAIVIFSAAASLYTLQTIEVPETCGTTAKEARSRGCEYDVMSFAWTPSRCFDPNLMAEFTSLRNWTFFTSQNGTEAVPYDSVALGEHDELFVTQEFHMYHCTYMWRKMHRAVLAAVPLDGYIGNYHHTSHCERQIMQKARKTHEISTTIFTKYVSCPFEQTDLGDRGWYRIIDGSKVYPGKAGGHGQS